MISICRTPRGCFVQKDGSPVHSDPISEDAARWLAADLEQDLGMLDRREHDLGHVYMAAATIRYWLMPGASLEANALSVALHAFGAAKQFNRGLN